jgi:hypothetical protein
VADSNERSIKGLPRRVDLKARALAPNVLVERGAAALSQSDLIYSYSSILPDLKRSYAACPLQRKLGQLDDNVRPRRK